MGCPDGLFLKTLAELKTGVKLVLAQQLRQGPTESAACGQKTPQTCSLSGDTHTIQMQYIIYHCNQNAVADFVNFSLR